jgi:hypothetical protein
MHQILQMDEGANNEIVILTGAVLSNTTNCELLSDWNVAEY